MNYASLNNIDIANGPGVRVSLFVSGCEHHCPGCFNEVAWDFQYGEPVTAEIYDKIGKMLSPDYIDGITILGGEPLHPRNVCEVYCILRYIKEKYPNKSVWLYTGYIFDFLLLESGIVSEILKFIDVMVDGPYIEGRRDLSLRFCGSDNQRVIDVPASLASGSVVLWGGTNIGSL